MVGYTLVFSKSAYCFVFVLQSVLKIKLWEYALVSAGHTDKIWTSYSLQGSKFPKKWKIQLFLQKSYDWSYRSNILGPWNNLWCNYEWESYKQIRTDTSGQIGLGSKAKCPTPPWSENNMWFNKKKNHSVWFVNCVSTIVFVLILLWKKNK